MRNAHVSRIIACAAFATGGLLGGGGLLLTGAGPASASPSCDTTGPILCIIPSTGLVNKQAVSVVVRAAPNTEIAVTECNAGVAASDPNACDSNPADLGKPGGPMLAQTGGKGNARITYKVLVSATKPVGDGNCLPGGNTCFLLAAAVATQTPVANPTPFTTG
jgi:hypothetical protein